MARISRTKKTLVVAAALALTIGGAGAAFAYWTSTGVGDGTATTGESVAFTITTEAAVGEISPGSAGQTIAFTVTNPGTGSQNLALVTVAVADDNGAPWIPPTGCILADFVATISTPPVYGQIAAGGELGGVATVTLTNTAVNQDACQGLDDVPLHFVAS